MAKVIEINVIGGLNPYNYETLSYYVSRIIAAKADYDAKLKAKESIYEWEYPPEVVFFNFNSGGGTTDGLLTAGKSIQALSEAGIPTIGFCGAKAASAAYTLMSCCDVVIALEGAELGSIAVASTYLDQTEALKQQGYNPIFYSTNSGKFSGLPGENKPEAEVKKLLKLSADTALQNIKSVILSKRPFLAEEIQTLNGGTVFVSKQLSSSLFDMIASSKEEVLFTLQKENIMNIKKFFTKSQANAGVIAQHASSSAQQGSFDTTQNQLPGTVQVAGTQDLTTLLGQLNLNQAPVPTQQQSTASAASAPTQPVVQLNLADLQTLINTAVSAQQAQQPQAQLQPQQQQGTPVVASNQQFQSAEGGTFLVADLQALQAYASVEGIEQSLVLQVLSVPGDLNVKKTVLKAMSASHDSTLVQAVNVNPLIAVAEALHRPTGTSAEETAFIADLNKAASLIVEKGLAF